MPQFYPSQQRSFISNIVFAFLIAALCVWILSLPVFPSQDGPMHRYYIHVLDSLLQRRGTYSEYQIRHPFPPYATHYAILLLLFRVFPYDLAEKLFVCAIVLCLSYGLRLSGKQIGPAGNWVTLLCVPLLLSWPLMMGFFNFTLGVGLALLATAFWQRIPVHGARSLAAFTVVLAVLTFTHPIPLLLLILLCCLDLSLSFLINPRPQGSTGLWLREHRLQAVALLFALVAAGFPALAADSTQAHSTLALFGLHLKFVRAYLLLYGLTPYSTPSLYLSINTYRLCLYIIYAGAMWVGGRATIRMLGRKQVNFGATIFLATLVLTIALPFLPDVVNGSAHFADRLLFVVWFGALLAASAAPVPDRRQQTAIALLSLTFGACTLIPAQIYIRPTSVEARKIELEPLPPNDQGAILPGYLSGQYVRYANQIGFDPFEWAAALAFVHQNDVVLNSPFISQKITPLQAAPNSPLLVDDIDAADPNLVPGHYLPKSREAQLVRESSFVVYVAPPLQLAQGLSNRLSPSEAAQYLCGPAHSWFLLCTKAKQPRIVP